MLGNNLSLEKRSVKYKLMISYALMSIVPLLCMGYFVTNYVFKELETEMVQVSIIVIFALWVSWMGCLLARTLILPAIDMAEEVKKIVKGQYDTKMPVSRKDEFGDIANGINIMVAKIRKQEEKGSSVEIVDRLTGLYTFSYLEECMREELKRAQYYQRPCSLIILNLDNFKKYADAYGEERTEDVLRTVAKILGEIVPPVGRLARTSPDEFGMLLPERNKREALEVAEKIRVKIANIDVPEGRITASVGVGENPIDGANVKEIFLSTRQYLDKAKKSGKNTVKGE
ncbi:MAG: sensor domain-containing diguanylate cyclase [Candidatus Aadella gelida]|nr:sensor domain-containing diguanylate cyclase [Candidatus Aadella gelida]